MKRFVQRMKVDLILINPPFSLPDKPYISVPTLAAYLKQKGLSVHGIDANIEFWREFLSSENLLASKKFAEQRLTELNERRELDFAQMLEYTRLLAALKETQAAEKKFSALFEPYPLSNVEKFSLFSRALKLASTPHFPESIEFIHENGYISYTSGESFFSSESILRSLEKPSLYSRTLEKMLPQMLKPYATPLIGISLTFPEQVLPAFKCAQIMKRCFPEAHITIGGAFVSCHMREFAHTGFFDVVDSFILDDGEEPLETLSRELASQSPDFSLVPGLVYLSGTKIVRNSPASPIDMNLLPPPDYSIFSIDRYLIKRSSMALLFRLSRGCYWGKCTFCRTELPVIDCHSQPSAEHIFNQLQAVITQTGVKIFHFTDDAASPEIVEELSQKIIEAGVKIKWVTHFRFDPRLTVERLNRYKQAGCHTINLGLESYSARILALMKKGISETLVERVLTDLSTAGIPAVVYMIVGFPTETEEEAGNSYKKLVGLKERGLIKRTIYTPFALVAYSAISVNPEKFGITRIHTEPGVDLMPPIMDFDSTGMERTRMFHLFTKFMTKPRSSVPPTGQRSRSTAPAPVLQLHNGRFHANFNVEKIQQKIQNVSFSEAELRNIDRIKQIKIFRDGNSAGASYF